MSRLRESILEQVIIIGNKSGCHQQASHSFFYHGKQFPVCARCTGVFIGQVIAVICILFSIMSNIILSTTLLLIMGLDWFVQEIRILESTNIRRLVTGILGGYGLFNLYAFFLQTIIKLIIK